ncbi:disease resistance protein RGA2-like isoform X2 [Hordeum vulgare subsp. vulgare]|uniref:disease resistance protein RGA2-like isoform X2 n=1 Tax=Hordeum vulgare subsp. vulgare TaxID=112509 RepID=UPI001D1A3498|nr:disease resistance protein RGA2-like isoform X2 [Hordeum vulgare subsp. vulgare]XP_044953688.1 disease resistance protein RGA2-like isoform X2 [Hordeum vulgare subsp. vulgare]
MRSTRRLLQLQPPAGETRDCGDGGKGKKKAANMTMILDAFASYVQNMLTEMVKEEVYMLLGVGDEIEKMDVKLGELKNFLADADRRNITDKRVQEWVAQLKRAMYEAADILDLCQLKAMERSPSTKDAGCFNPLLFCMRNPSHAHNIGTRIKALNKRLDTIKERSAAFSFIPLGSYEDHGRKAHGSHSRNTRRETSGEFDRSGVVGEKIEQDTRKLVEMMLTEKKGNTNIMVVAIVGVGGIGKTTLAQKIFNDEALNAEFERTIWLSINKDVDKVELLRTIITQAGGVHGGEKALAVLQPILATTLKGKKLFLVLDDVWEHGAWDDVLKTPLVNVVARGSRVLVTTRDETIARRMKVVFPYHHVDKLEEDDAWSLLKKQIISSETDECEIDMLKDIGVQIVAKCDGLPLALKVMGGILCQKDKKQHEWKMVLDDSIWSNSGLPEELNHAVYLSYEDLSSCAKQCFLHYSLLPKTAVFSRNEIIGMWISEGFLHGTLDDLEELGIKYYQELILRNLIEPNTQFVDQCVCNMHDVVRSFAQFVARDETLAAHSGETNIVTELGAHEFHRLSLESKASELNGLDWSSLQAQKTLRVLISVGYINIKPGDSLIHFPCLRTLHIFSAHVVVLLESLQELKHLRYLSIVNADISSLPDSVGKLKFLQYISLRDCKQFVKLPHSILKLGQLRYLNLSGTSINGITRGFRVLTNLRKLIGFPAHVDGDWCSLEELGPLSRLKVLRLDRLKNITDSSSATKAKLDEKVHLAELSLYCASRLGDDGMIKEEGSISEEEKQQIEKVFDELCPPPRLENLDINGYFGRSLPRWMMSSSAMPFKSLRNLLIDDLACCTTLPDGLCQLPYLEFIQILRAPAVKRVGPEFMQSYQHHNARPSQMVAAFPRLHEMNLTRMVEWEEWEWEQQVQAFPVLQELTLDRCKLKCLPPGLASQARSLNKLRVSYVQGVISVENFPSLVELHLDENHDLERITNLPRLQKLTIGDCPKLKVLEGVPALQRLVLSDNNMETLPEYMGGTNPMHFELYCSLALLASIAIGQSGPGWDKFGHVQHVKAYAREGDNGRKWYVLYTAKPYNLETNVSLSFMSRGTLTAFEDAQRFESLFKMRRKTFSYICSLVMGPSMEDMNNYTFVDGRVMSLEDRVAVALRRLQSSEPTKSIASSVGVNEPNILSVTERFVDTMWEKAVHHSSWPDCNEKDKIKSKFDKIHNMHNCCGVICTTHIPFGPNCNHEKNDCIQMQLVIDPDMRFKSIWLGLPSSMNQLSLLQDSTLFKECEKGGLLNGSKLKVGLDGSEAGEYIIGDAGYPLLPWLLTPYKEDLSDFKAEFNRRHSAATTRTLKALTRLKDTWKYLLGEAWWPADLKIQTKIIYACCRLHNIVIEMVDDAAMLSTKRKNYSKEVRQIAKEDAIRARDMLSQHFMASRSSKSGG